MTFTFLTQPELVRLSLLVDEQREHRHDAPARRRLVPGAERTAGTDDRVAPRVHTRPSTQAGRDRRSGGSSLVHDECGICPLLPSLDGQYDLVDLDECPIHGIGPTARTIPGTDGRRLA